MQKAYIILVHKNGQQVERLLQRLDDEQSCFFLHIDKNSSLEEFKTVVNKFAKKIKLVKREAIEWGGFGLVQATINALQAVNNHQVQFDWIILLSGQDYPIKSSEYINSFLLGTSHAAFFDFTKLPDYDRWFPRGGYYRLDKYYLGLTSQAKLTAKALNLFATMLPIIRRRSKNKLVPYAGSQWWMINNETLVYIMKYLQQNPSYKKFHKYTFAADEVFFHTIIMNAEQLKDKVKNDNKRFLIWPDTSKAHPEVLKEYDINAIASSDALFARKFDTDEDERILDLIDARCFDCSFIPVVKNNEEVSVHG